jgi:hypothetical protein
VDAELLSSLRQLARSEGRQLQALVDEALSDLIDKRKQTKPRPPVMAAYQSSHVAFAALYRQLAE